MQRLPTPARARRPRLLVVELWGLGDVALAIPFLRAACDRAEVTLLAQAHAAPLLRRFAPDVRHVAWRAPWTAFAGKYRLVDWPWTEIARLIPGLRGRHFAAAVSARRDPRDHALLALSGAALRAGFPRVGSRCLLTDVLPAPRRPHRAAHWEQLAAHLGWELAPAAPAPRTGRRIVLHPGAGQPVREWPRERFAEIARRLAGLGWEVDLIDGPLPGIEALLDRLDAAHLFIGNDSGPGHLAALLGVPTFTIFGPQLPALFAPQHPRAAWIDGAPCAFKPCSDSCRFGSPHCIRELSVDAVWAALQPFLRCAA